jgi:uncharacterized membrane protein
MSETNVTVATFDEPSKAYQALSELKHDSAQGKIKLHSAAVVERTPSGGYEIKDSVTPKAGFSTSTGGLVGALIGILGGPIGVLLGWGACALAGAALEADDARSGLAMLRQAGERIQPGSTGLFAELEGDQPHQTDWQLGQLGGTVTRWTAAEISNEIESARDAQTAAEKEARRVVGERHGGGFGDRVQNAVEEFKERLPGGTPR